MINLSKLNGLFQKVQLQSNLYPTRGETNPSLVAHTHTGGHIDRRKKESMKKIRKTAASSKISISSGEREGNASSADLELNEIEVLRQRYREEAPAMGAQLSRSVIRCFVV